MAVGRSIRKNLFEGRGPPSTQATCLLGRSVFCNAGFSEGKKEATFHDLSYLESFSV